VVEDSTITPRSYTTKSFQRTPNFPCFPKKSYQRSKISGKKCGFPCFAKEKQACEQATNKGARSEEGLCDSNGGITILSPQLHVEYYDKPTSYKHVMPCIVYKITS
jgi:hypothetical protein